MPDPALILRAPLREKKSITVVTLANAYRPDPSCFSMKSTKYSPGETDVFRAMTFLQTVTKEWYRLGSRDLRLESGMLR